MIQKQTGASQNSSIDEDKITTIRSPVSFLSHMATTGARTDIDSVTVVNRSPGPETNHVYARSLGYSFSESSGTSPHKLYVRSDSFSLKYA